MFCCLAELTTALQEGLKRWNENARPFTWTKNADQLIDAIGPLRRSNFRPAN
ncbi:hypothetical protein [Nonomuraea phyllanthi]|uniref:hypothetical protein n=1 Tax=Nonomuraea phyllanthi TaxID=2219224 RepID=UPI001292F3A1|nr:hypothetical protein [Nonomuraea phyllanthi]